MGPMGTLAPAPRLLGRETELRALGDAVGRVAAGHLTIVPAASRW